LLFESCNGRSLLLHCAMLFQKLIEQHRVHSVVRYGMDSTRDMLLKSANTPSHGLFFSR
jgi:hypothetical protein